MNGSLRRLNLDTSWWVDLSGSAIVFDPWLVGSEVDFAPWFNEQWHTGPVLGLDEVPAHAVVVISQLFTDHLHAETLAGWRGDAVIAVVPEAAAAVRALNTGRAVLEIPAWGQPPLRVTGLSLWRVSGPWWRPPRYHAIVVADAQGRAVVHAPHGLSPADAAAIAQALTVEVLAITWVGYRLPWFLGGAVNPGPEAADAAVRASGARRVLAVHDEARRAQGLVSRLARIDRRPLPGAPWMPVDHTEPVPLLDAGDPAHPAGCC